jgi:hypothetical protein
MWCDPETMTRVFIHYLVDEIPAAGLDEALETLHSISVFHRPRLESLQPLRNSPIKVTVLGRTERPIIPLPME